MKRTAADGWWSVLRHVLLSCYPMAPSQADKAVAIDRERWSGLLPADGYPAWYEPWMYAPLLVGRMARMERAGKL